MSLLASLLAHGTAPALTWYDADGRVELSGKVLANHVAKVANYLSDEVGLEPGAPVLLDLPLHWKTLTWALGALVAGGRIRDAGAAGADVVVTNRPEAHAGASAAEVIALNLDSFAFAWDGDLPQGVADGSADVMGQPDSLVLAEGTDNVERARGTLVIAEPSLLFRPTVAEATRALLAACAGGASLVVVGEGDPERIAAAQRARIL